MFIKQETLDTIHNVTRIDEIISDFITLKKKGQNYWANCPFHDEKSPSFSVSPNKGFYKCFGCDAKGDTISFLRELEGMSFNEAVEYIANKNGIVVEYDDSASISQKEIDEKDTLLIIYQKAKEYFINKLSSADNPDIPNNYLNKRGIPLDFIQRFEIGYSESKWDGLYKHLKSIGYKEELLQKSGLIIHNEEGKYYDRFRDRIIFPINNSYGKTIAFGGRILNQGKNQPKYINSPESIIYHKSKILYGLDKAKKSIKELNNCYIVEGYTDVVSLHIAGIQNVVASGGTSLTKEQILQIRRFTNNITIIFDGDYAGYSASMRGIDLVLENDMDVKVITLPDGEDPDTYAHKLEPSEFKHYLESNSQDFLNFKTNILKKEFSKDISQKAKSINSLLKSISCIKDPVKRNLFIKECSKNLDMNENVLIEEVNIIISKSDNKYHNKQKPKKNLNNILPKISSREILERDILQMLLRYIDVNIDSGKLNNYIFNELEDIEFRNQSYMHIYHYLRENIKSPDDDTEYKSFTKNIISTLISSAEENIKETVIDLIAEKYEISPQWEERSRTYINKESDNLKENAYKNILKLKLKIVKEMIIENQKNIKADMEESQYLEVLKIHDFLKKREVDITKKLGIVYSSL